MDHPPTIEALIGSPPPVCGLDEQSVAEHFFGKTQREIREALPRNGMLVAEDFKYMAPAGLLYYLPPAYDYLRDDESRGKFEFCLFLIGALSNQVQSSRLPSEVLALIKEIANFCEAQREKFGFEPDDDLFDEYILRIWYA